jgi:hypothetical protein
VVTTVPVATPGNGAITVDPSRHCCGACSAVCHYNRWSDSLFATDRRFRSSPPGRRLSQNGGHNDVGHDPEVPLSGVPAQMGRLTCTSALWTCPRRTRSWSEARPSVGRPASVVLTVRLFDVEQVGSLLVLLGKGRSLRPQPVAAVRSACCSQRG